MAAADFAILAVYLLVVLLVGSLFRSGQTSLKDFFLAGRNIPWWAAAFSGIATMVSAIGYLGAPGQAYAADWTYLQARLAWPIAIAGAYVLFIPLFFRLELFTAYEYLEQRFDLRTRLLAGGIFILLKCFYAGIAIYAPALIVAEMTGLPFFAIVAGIGLLTTFYTTIGGMRAVIWTDTVQFVVLTGGLVVAFELLVGSVDGGFSGVLSAGAAAGKFRMFDWTLDFDTEFTVWNGLIGGTFFLLSQYAVDQAELQRFLTTSSMQKSRYAMVSTMVFTSIYGFIVFFMGTALWVFYQQHPESLGAATDADRMFPKFILEEFPVGLKGLLIAGVFAAAMSTVSSVLNSLATVALRDFYQPLAKREGSVAMARNLTILFGLIATGVSLYADSFGTILVAQGKIRNFFGGSLVGVFLLGILVPRATASGGFWGLIAGFAGVSLLSAFTEVSWMWHGAFSALVCMAVGVAISGQGRSRP